MTTKLDADTATIAHAQAWVSLRAGKGTHCPVCDQYVKVYHRPLGSQMARWLIWLVCAWEKRSRSIGGVKFPEVWIDIKDATVRGGDYGKLRHWGLIEQKPNDRGKKDTRDSGLWRPTLKGVDFVYGRITVGTHVDVYNNTKLGEETKQTTIWQALGKQYSYTELMDAHINEEVLV